MCHAGSDDQRKKVVENKLIKIDSTLLNWELAKIIKPTSTPNIVKQSLGWS